MSRRALMAGNWKMHKTIAESVALAGQLAAALRSQPDRDALICPPFTALSAVSSALKGSPVLLGAQNMSENLQGAFTGEVSGAMIKDAGCSFVILGHSERREYNGESDALVNKKCRAALDQGLAPIVCVGERLEQREGGKMFSVIEAQLAGSLAGLSPAQAAALVVAYEPVWAIGTGRTATPDQAQEVHAFIRGKLAEAFGAETAAATRILYGGSVKPDNIDALMAKPDIDGGLVGGASLKAEDFARIVNYKKA